MEISDFLDRFTNSNILLLQGPLGPFFYRLQKCLKARNNRVFKINFTGGDFLFYPSGTNFRGDEKQLVKFYEKFFSENKIDVIFLFSDTRKVHEIAIKIANKKNISVFVFEQGYLRPNYITCELGGVNANSPMPRNKNFYKKWQKSENLSEFERKNLAKIASKKQNSHAAKNFHAANLKMGFFAFLYHSFSYIAAPFFNNALYHRKIYALEGILWWRHLARKYYYKFREKNITNRATSRHKQYFLAVLQVHNDSQIKKHYRHKKNEFFIKECIKSFAKNAAAGHTLVFKHHPLDIAYTDYGKLIKKIAKKFGVEDRIFYVHDTHLPTLLKHAIGCVCVNSTTGLQSLHHKTPTKLLADTAYNIDGLVAGGSLDEFWNKKSKVDYDLYEKIRTYLLCVNQINANFYSKITE